MNYAEDPTWKTGHTAPLGWGNLGAAAPYLGLGTPLPAGEQGITTYFRRVFTLENPDGIRSLALELLTDDGAVAFLNGVAFPPVNLDPGTAVGGVAGIGSEKLAAGTKGDGPGEVTVDALTADSSVLGALRAGTNVLTVEVHQASATSGDAVCDARISTTLHPPGGGSFGTLNIDQTPYVTWDEPNRVLEESADLVNWKRLVEPPNPFPMDQNRPRLFYRVQP